jgi:hypothetical protein
MTKGYLAALILACAPAWSLTAANLEAQVTIPYTEFQKLLDSARQRSEGEARAPIPASVSLARYQLDLSGDVVTGSAQFEVQTFSEDWQMVPLLDTQARITAVEPAASRIVLRDGRYALLTDTAGRTSVTLRFVLPWDTRVGGNPRLSLKRIEALVNTLAVTGVPEGSEVTVADATKSGPDYQLDADGPLEVGIVSSVAVAAADALDSLPRVQMIAAVVESATGQTRVVPDGSLLSEMRYTISHKTPVTWSLALPTGSELLSFSIDGESFAPVDRGEGHLEVELPATSGKPTDISFSYANRVEALAPVSGRLELELPLTPLLIREVQWQIDLPAGYELAALDGNVVAVDAVSKEGLHIRVRKELCRNERPTVQIFYRKPAQ